MYNIDYTQEAINDLKRLQKDEPKVYEKVRRFTLPMAITTTNSTPEKFEFFQN